MLEGVAEHSDIFIGRIMDRYAIMQGKPPKLPDIRFNKNLFRGEEGEEYHIAIIDGYVEAFVHYHKDYRKYVLCKESICKAFNNRFLRHCAVILDYSTWELKFWIFVNYDVKSQITEKGDLFLRCDAKKFQRWTIDTSISSLWEKDERLKKHIMTIAKPFLEKRRSMLGIDYDEDEIKKFLKGFDAITE